MTRTPGAPSPAPLPTARPPGCPFDPPPELARLRTTQSISRLAYPDGHVGWLVTSHALVRAVLADPRFSRRNELMHSPVPLATANETLRAAPPGFFMRMDPPEHTRYRRLLTGQFTVRRMRQLTPRIQQIAAEQLDAMQQAGPPADLVQAFALPLPSLVICELLGLPHADREHFQRHSAVLLRPASTTQQMLASWTAIHDHLRELVAAKRSEPADDLLSGLIAGGELTDEELINMGVLLLVAGHETTANMLALGTFVLLQQPEQLAALRADPGVTDHAVEELLRYLTIIHVGPVRAALEDVEVGGQLIKAGETVTTSASAANRDPEQFADPDTLDLHRSAAGHLAFGHGIHQCLGQQLARIEMQVGYTALFDRFPTLRLAVAPEEVPLRTDMSIYGVHRLPVTWEEARD